MFSEAAKEAARAPNMRSDPFESAIRRFDEENRRDPRTAEFDGQSHPREYLHAIKVSGWIEKLAPAASAELRLAARCNALRRWEIPRDTYPKTTAGYHRWRKALQAFHAKAASDILRDAGFGDDVLAKVEALIFMKNFPADPEAQALEDADCLTFLETKFHAYLSEWDEPKTVRILKGTLGKMSERARKIALDLPLSEAGQALIRKALG